MYIRYTKKATWGTFSPMKTHTKILASFKTWKTKKLLHIQTTVQKWSSDTSRTLGLIIMSLVLVSCVVQTVNTHRHGAHGGGQAGPRHSNTQDYPAGSEHDRLRRRDQDAETQLYNSTSSAFSSEQTFGEKSVYLITSNYNSWIYLNERDGNGRLIWSNVVVLMRNSETVWRAQKRK